MRMILAGAILSILLLCGCGSYNEVNQGMQGPTSPAESGQHGSSADQIASSDQEEIHPIDHPFTNGFTDPSMEGSGNIAAQGDYKEVIAAEQQKQQANQPTPAPSSKAPKGQNRVKPAESK